MAQNKLLLIWFFFLIAIPIILSGQHPRQDKMPAIGEISGTVVDSLTGKPLEYASISILKVNGEIETGGVTNKDGTFHIKEIKPSNYSIKIEFMGYAPTVISNIMLTFRGTLKKHIGTIKLNQILIPIDGATVIEDRPLFEFKTDKMIYNSSDDIIADSGTAEDILNKVPMVTVDQDGEVSLRGNPNVKILVNGRPNRTGEGGKSVDNIPASLIDKVEVITSPSAKYDPDGMAGIINIVLKKGKYEGLNGSLKINGKSNVNAGIGDMNGITAYGNYKGEKWNLYSSVNTNNRLRIVEGGRKVTTTYTDLSTGEIDSTKWIDFDFLNNSDRRGVSLKLGADYSINEHLIVNGEINYDRHLHNGVNIQNIILPRPYTKTINDSDFDNNYDFEGFFDINQTFNDPDREFNFSVSYDYQKDNERESLHPDTTSLYQTINGIDIDISYKHPLNKKSIVELGYDGKINDNAENMDFQIPEESSGVSFIGKNTFGYKRAIHGFWLEYDYKPNEKFSVKPSMRYEYVRKDISFKSVNNIQEPSNIYSRVLYSLGDSTYTYINNYSTLYPDLHFTYNLTEKQSIQFGLSKRVNRPGSGGHGHGSRQIRPFPRDIYSDNFIFVGNPFLKPEYSTQYELSYKSPVPLGFAYVNLYYHQLKNVIEWYDDDRFEDKDILTFKNADSGESMGLEFFGMIMGQTIGGGYNLSKLDDPSGDYELNGNSQRLTLYNRINLPEKYIKYFSFEFGFFFMKMTVPGGDLFGAKGALWANMGISKTLFNESLEISLGIDNLLDRGGFEMKRNKPLYNDNGIIYANELTDISTSRGGRTFKLNIIYRFGKMQNEKRKQERNIKRGGGDGMMDMGF